ncbi:helix-turn-helix protein [Murinocardiopsis flavida]|uniref:Helix-turn-helix protein n=1 Tax=Murinocardiopsis flavida TaxID=645275 RepID=A0A2P8DP25_9ACTN|nr:helix-turn-helix transcriptional regulator [Murinocardiopsis flavida]PSK98974.1 helix-turn-helix protein [Murinocardiopsis flavida]
MAMKKISPVWKRYGAEVRKWRELAQLTQTRLAAKVSLSSSAVSYIEAGVLRPQADHAHALDAALDAGGALVRMWEEYTKQGTFPVGFRQFVDFERIAIELHEYQNILVPGIVQTADYARALISQTRHGDSKESIDLMVESRMRRQAIFARPDPPLLLLVVEEVAIRQVVGNAAIAARQLDRLAALAEERKIRLQVVPQGLSPHPALLGPFRMYIFKDRPTIASCEHAVDEQVIDDAEQVRRLRGVFGALQAEALCVSESVDLIRRIQGGIDE